MKGLKSVMFSQSTQHWASPDDMFMALDREFGFTLDPCPLHATLDAFSFQWNGIVYVNPPYGRGIGAWIERGIKFAAQGSTVVFLLPVRTDTRWFHELVLPAKPEIRFIRGRLHFGGAKNAAPFPSMLLIFGTNKQPRETGRPVACLEHTPETMPGDPVTKEIPEEFR